MGRSDHYTSLTILPEKANRFLTEALFIHLTDPLIEGGSDNPNRTKHMIRKMNLVRPALLAALLCGVSATVSLAQDPAASPAPSSPGSLTAPPPPPAQPYHGMPPSPLFDALDTNHDGVLSAEEIANASASLKALLKNGSDHPHPRRPAPRSRSRPPCGGR